MTLIGESRQVGHFGKRVGRRIQQVQGFFDAELADVVAKREVIEITGKGAGNIGGVDFQTQIGAGWFCWLLYPENTTETVVLPLFQPHRSTACRDRYGRPSPAGTDVSFIDQAGRAGIVAVRNAIVQPGG